MKGLFQTDLNIIWDEIDIKPKNRRGCGLWKEDYIKKIISELIELKIKAKKENKPKLYEQLRMSLMRAHKVQNKIS